MPLVDPSGRPAAPRRASSPFHVIAKPVGPACNLACSYCYYLGADARRGARPGGAMEERLLERFVREYIESQPEGIPELNFVWQGGEPALAGLAFYRKAVAFQRRFSRPGLAVTNSFQTNGTLLDGDWAAFFRDEGFLVGLSIDGPAELHDAVRRGPQGGSHAAALRGLEALLRAGVETNLLAVLGSAGAERGASLYRYLAGLGAPYLHFIPLVARPRPAGAQASASEVAAASGFEAAPGAVGAAAWGAFLLDMFREWLSGDIGKVFVQEFEAALAARHGSPAPVCTGLAECGRAFVLERDGMLYACDHFVDAGHRLGGIRERPLAELVEGSAAFAFGEGKRLGLAARCRSCPHLAACYGECPKNRDAEGRNLLCEGWLAFHEGSAPVFDAMSAAIRRGMPAAEYRLFLAAGAGPGS